MKFIVTACLMLAGCAMTQEQSDRFVQGLWGASAIYNQTHPYYVSQPPPIPQHTNCIRMNWGMSCSTY